MVAETEGIIGSVIFDIDAGLYTKIADFPPYSLGGALRDRLLGVAPLLVSDPLQVVRVTPFSGTNGQGIEGQTISIVLQLVDPLHIGSIVYNTTGGTLRELTNGGIINLLELDSSQQQHQQVVLQVQTGGPVGSVDFNLNNYEIHTVDSEEPYQFNNTLLFTPGHYVLKVTPWTDNDGTGSNGETKRIEFDVISQPGIHSVELTLPLFYNLETLNEDAATLLVARHGISPLLRIVTFGDVHEVVVELIGALPAIVLRPPVDEDILLQDESFRSPGRKTLLLEVNLPPSMNVQGGAASSQLLHLEYVVRETPTSPSPPPAGEPAAAKTGAPSSVQSSLPSTNPTIDVSVPSGSPAILSTTSMPVAAETEAPSSMQSALPSDNPTSDEGNTTVPSERPTILSTTSMPVATTLSPSTAKTGAPSSVPSSRPTVNPTSNEENGALPSGSPTNGDDGAEQGLTSTPTTTADPIEKEVISAFVVSNQAGLGTSHLNSFNNERLELNDAYNRVAESALAEFVETNPLVEYRLNSGQTDSFAGTECPPGITGSLVLQCHTVTASFVLLIHSTTTTESPNVDVISMEAANIVQQSVNNGNIQCELDRVNANSRVTIVTGGGCSLGPPTSSPSSNDGVPTPMPVIVTEPIRRDVFSTFVVSNQVGLGTSQLNTFINERFELNDAYNRLAESTLAEFLETNPLLEYRWHSGETDSFADTSCPPGVIDSTFVQCHAVTAVFVLMIHHPPAITEGAEIAPINVEAVSMQAAQIVQQSIDNGDLQCELNRINPVSQVRVETGGGCSTTGSPPSRE